MMNWYGGWGVGGWLLMSLIMLRGIGSGPTGQTLMTSSDHRVHCVSSFIDDSGVHSWRSFPR